MKKVFIIFFFAISSIVSATKYYVSSTGGNDAFDGKSETAAWKTISKVNGYSFAAGDIISFKCGDIWRERLNVPRSGTAGAHMVFNSYGTGDRPKLYGSSKTTTWSAEGHTNIWKSDVTTFADPYTIHSTEDCEIFFVETDNSISWSNEKSTYTSDFANLTEEHDWTWNGDIIYIYSTSDPDVAYNSVEIPQLPRVIYLGSYDYLEINGFDIKFTAIGVDAFEQTTGQNRIGLILDNCKISWIGSPYAQTSGEAPGQGYGTQFMRSEQIIRNCDISECGRRLTSFHLYDGDNITLNNWLFENNYFHDGHHATGISPRFVGGRQNNKIIGMIIRNNLFTEPEGKYPDATQANSNMIYMEVSETGAEIRDVQIYNNIFMYCTQVDCIVTGTVNNVGIYNNTFYEHNHHTAFNVVHIKSQSLNGKAPTKITIKNNIFYNTGTRSQNTGQHSIYIDQNVDPLEFDIDYNLFYYSSVDLALVHVYNIYYYTNRAGYKNMTNLLSEHGWQQHSPTNYLVSPGFVSATDLHLQVGSPAIGAGIAIPEIATDFEGKTYNNPPNIGCFATQETAGNPVYVISAIENDNPFILEMIYNLTLANIVPSASSFTVRINTLTRTVKTVSISGTKVLLTLSSPIVYGDVVTVAYTKPATNPLQTVSGGQAATISARTVTNKVIAVNPVYVSSAIENTTPSILGMTYNLTLTNIIPSDSSFAVWINTLDRTVNTVSISGTKVLLTLSSPVVYGDVITVAYTKPGINPLQTTSGGQAASISAKSVTNNCSAPIPVYSSSVVENATPALLEMTYNLSLADIAPAASAFSVQVNSSGRIVNSVSIASGQVQLTLASAVIYGDVVTVAYTSPASNPLQITSGGQAASISAQPVTNNYTPPIPVYSSSVVENATPALLEMTYNLSLADIAPAASAYNVKVNSLVRIVNSVAIASRQVQLTLASAVIYDDVVTVSYTRPTNNPLQTTSGGQAASISAQSVTNNCASESPIYVSALVANPNPRVIEITYNLSLSDIIPPASAYNVQVNSVNMIVNLVTIADGEVLLDLASEMTYGDVVTVSYTIPDTNPLQTTSGGQAASITIQPVNNNIDNPLVTQIKRSIIESKISIYPNPAHEYFNISFDKSYLMPLIIKIINRSGATVFENFIESGINYMQFPIKFGSGLYFVQLISNGISLETQKLIVN